MKAAQPFLPSAGAGNHLKAAKSACFTSSSRGTALFPPWMPPGAQPFPAAGFPYHASKPVPAPDQWYRCRTGSLFQYLFRHFAAHGPMSMEMIRTVFIGRGAVRLCRNHGKAWPGAVFFIRPDLHGLQGMFSHIQAVMRIFLGRTHEPVKFRRKLQ